MSRAYHEDRRMYNTAGPVMRWYKENEQYLVNRQPVATVGVVWSQRNTDFFGRDDAADVWTRPTPDSCTRWCGRACRTCPSTRTISTAGGRDLKLLILPNVAAFPMRSAHPSAASSSAAVRCSQRATPASTTNGATHGRISRWRIYSARTASAKRRN